MAEMTFNMWRYDNDTSGAFMQMTQPSLGHAAGTFSWNLVNGQWRNVRETLDRVDALASALRS